MFANLREDATVHDILPVDLEYIPEDLKIRARVELFEDDNKTVQSLKLLKSKMKEEHGLLWQDDDLFLMAFLRARKFDVDRAFNLVKSFYRKMGKHGDLYYTMTFDRLKIIMETQLLTFLPYRDKDGCVIILYRCIDWDPQKTTALEQTLCSGLGMIEALRCPATQISGFHLICDFKGYSMMQLVHTNPAVLRLFNDIVQESIPARMRGFHIVNENNFVAYLWPLVKMCLSQKLRDRIHVHGKDLSSLHKFFHPSVLPADLGGELPPFDNTDWRQKMEASKDYLMNVLSHGYEKYLKRWKNKNSYGS